MGYLILITLVIIAVTVGACILCKIKCKSEKAKYITLLIASILTILCHYSSLIYHLIVDGECWTFLTSNPNLILPIYPCNLVMICCLLLGIKRDKEDKFAHWLIDYIFYFGVVSCLVGMFANVDFIKNPTLADYDITKSIVAHGFMFFNVMLLPFLGYVKVDFLRNIPNIIISILLMFVDGLHIALICRVFGGESMAMDVNPMFILHSPFGPDFIVYPVIAGIALLGYIIVLWIIELFVYPKNKQWFHRLKEKNQNKKSLNI